MPRSLIVAIAAMSLVTLAACGSSDGEVAGPTTRLTLLPTTTTTLPPPTTEVDPVGPGTSTSTTSTTVAGGSAAETGNVTTTTEPAVTTTADPADAAVEALVLSDDGIGAAVFSGDPDGVVSFLSTFVGPPTDDTGWVDPFTISACGGSELRVVSFGSLRLTFGDVSPVLEGRRHFFAYTYGAYAYDGLGVTVTDQTPPGLLTEEGIGLGSSLVSVEAVYPGLQLNPADDFFPETFVVNDNFRGALTGLADDSTVVNIVGGQDCADPT